MTKQEEIREILDKWADDQCLYLEQQKSCESRSDVGYCSDGVGAYRCLMERLNSKGVVMKVHAVMAGQHMTGVYLVEPLIGEG